MGNGLYTEISLWSIGILTKVWHVNERGHSGSFNPPAATVVMSSSNQHPFRVQFCLTADKYIEAEKEIIDAYNSEEFDPAKFYTKDSMLMPVGRNVAKGPEGIPIDSFMHGTYTSLFP